MPNFSSAHCMCAMIGGDKFLRRFFKINNTRNSKPRFLGKFVLRDIKQGRGRPYIRWGSSLLNTAIKCEVWCILHCRFQLAMYLQRTNFDIARRDG